MRTSRIIAASLAVAAATAGVWLVAGSRRVPAGAVALVDSPLRGTRVLEPGRHALLAGIERIEILDPYRRADRVTLQSGEGARIDLDLTLALRLSAAGARELLAQGGDGPARERLDRALEARLREALTLPAAGGLPDLDAAALERVGTALRVYGTLEGPLTLDYAADSAVAQGLRESRSAERLQAATRATGVRLLLVGLDGADWQIAEPLIERGQLPNLAALRRRGAWGNVKALTPILSPLLWTSVATGVGADRHGIVDFLTVDRVSGRQVPVSSRLRRVRALWNQFGEAGRTSDIVAWWATWPAEAIRGRMVSDRVSYSLFDFEAPSAGAGATHPPELYDTLRPLLVDDAAIPYEEVARFCDITRQEFAASRAQIAGDRKRAYRDPVNHLTKILAATRNYHRSALELLRTGQADLTAVYYQGIDEVGHRFMHFALPRRPEIGEDDARRFGHVVERFYVYQDELLGELLAAAAPETTVVVVSDHGFVNGTDRPAGQTADIEGQPARWHRRYGVLVLAGPPIRQQRLDTTSLLDISPTVLALAGLPVPEDTEGRVLTEALGPAFLARFPPESIATYETTPFRPHTVAGGEAVAAIETEMLENLRSLGYVGGTSEIVSAPAEHPEDALAPHAEETESTTITGHVNLAGVLLGRGDLAGAEREITAALAQVPSYEPARRQLFDLRLRQDRPAEAIAVGEALLEQASGLDDVFLSRLARAYEAAGRAEQAIERYRTAFAAGRLPAGVVLARLLLERGQRAAAATVALEVLAREPHNVGAMATLMQVGRPEDLAAAVPALTKALERNPRSVSHLNWLAVVRESQGNLAEAEALLARALAVDPDHGPAMANLGAFYLRARQPQRAVPLLERALRIDPANLDARINCGTALAMTDRLREAIEQFVAAVEQGTRNPAVYNALARAHGQLGEGATAADWLRRSLAIDPQQAEVRRKLAALEATR